MISAQEAREEFERGAGADVEFVRAEFVGSPPILEITYRVPKADKVGFVGIRDFEERGNVYFAGSGAAAWAALKIKES